MNSEMLSLCTEPDILVFYHCKRQQFFMGQWPQCKMI